MAGWTNIFRCITNIYKYYTNIIYHCMHNSKIIWSWDFLKNEFNKNCIFFAKKFYNKGSESLLFFPGLISIRHEEKFPKIVKDWIKVCHIDMIYFMSQFRKNIAKIMLKML